MKQVMMSVLILASVFLGINSAEAQNRFNENYRIKKGAQHGTLTRTEARGLRAQQHQLTQMKRMAMADGRITPSERNMIQNAEKKLNRNIYYQKHDRQTRF
jgi:uncharacterized tellurite resistance protein B-like protein